VRSHHPFKLLILAGGDFAPFTDQVKRLGLSDRVIVRTNVVEVEDYLQAADLGVFTSKSESFCLSILEAAWFGCPSVSTAVGGIPEVVTTGETGVLVPEPDPAVLAQAVQDLLDNPERRAAMGHAAERKAKAMFSAAAIVPQYEALYRRVCAGG